MAISITSPHFESGHTIPAQFTCTGEDISPALRWDGVPAEAKSLVLLVNDPDAPAGTWIHWAVIHIPPQTLQVANHAVPTGGTEIMNSFGKTAWGGPCPPNGQHRYFFKLFALDSASLTVSKADDLAGVMAGHILASGELVGLYQLP